MLIVWGSFNKSVEKSVTVNKSAKKEKEQCSRETSTNKCSKNTAWLLFFSFKVKYVK